MGRFRFVPVKCRGEHRVDGFVYYKGRAVEMEPERLLVCGSPLRGVKCALKNFFIGLV